MTSYTDLGVWDGGHKPEASNRLHAGQEGCCNTGTHNYSSCSPKHHCSLRWMDILQPSAAHSQRHITRHCPNVTSHSTFPTSHHTALLIIQRALWTQQVGSTLNILGRGQAKTKVNERMPRSPATWTNSCGVKGTERRATML